MSGAARQPETREQRDRRIARAKIDHDTKMTLGWPAVRAPRTPADVEPNAHRTAQTNRARSFESTTKAAKAMRLSHRVTAGLRA